MEKIVRTVKFQLDTLQTNLEYHFDSVDSQSSITFRYFSMYYYKIKNFINYLIMLEFEIMCALEQ
jgi:hypothetical protein